MSYYMIMNFNNRYALHSFTKFLSQFQHNIQISNDFAQKTYETEVITMYKKKPKNRTYDEIANVLNNF